MVQQFVELLTRFVASQENIVNVPAKRETRLTSNSVKNEMPIVTLYLPYNSLAFL